jgi:hypothetical protein
MTQIAASTMRTLSAPERARQIDVGTALDLLAQVIDGRAEDLTDIPVADSSHRDRGYLYAFDGQPRCIVGHALAKAGVDVQQLEEMGDMRLRDLYRVGRVPAMLTLGGLIAFDAAQQSQALGRSWSAALDDAAAAVARYLDLVGVVPEATRYLERCAERCPFRDNAAKE